MRFVGEDERQLDEKGRVAIPATHRAGLGEWCYAATGMDRCIEVFTEEDFDRRLDEIEASVERGDLHRNDLRAFSSAASRIKLDAQGRILLSDKLLAHATLTPNAPALVVGSSRKLEIWLPERFRLIAARGNGVWMGDDPLVESR